MRVPDGVAVPARCAVLLFVDGLDKVVFERMRAAGELPEIERYIASRGATVENAVVGIPSITYANTVTFLTGRLPGHHDILANAWFDRRTLVWKTYMESATYRDVNGDFAAPTLYEALPVEYYTVNIQCAARRGVDATLDNWAESGVCWFFGWYEWADGWVARDFEQFERLARRSGRWPDFVHAYLPGVDAVGHRYGSESAEYRHALANIDRQVGKMARALQRAGVLERTYLLLTSDHGHVPIEAGQNFDLTAWLTAAHGWRVYEGGLAGGTREMRARRLSAYDAVAINDGNRQYALHLPGRAGWTSRPGFARCRDVVADGPWPLVSPPAVRLAACRKAADQVWLCGPVRARSVSKGPSTEGARALAGASGSEELHGANPPSGSRLGEAVVSRRRDGNRLAYRYDVVAGDPLGYQDDAKLAAFVEEGWHESRAWLAATAGAPIPDLVPQIVAYFDSPRAPDVLVFAAEGWDFAASNRGGHGSITRREMVVPMLIAGPGIQPGTRLPAARSADVAPTIVELLAGPERLSAMGPMDGVSLVPQRDDTPTSIPSQ